MAKVVVIGAAGYVGVHLCREPTRMAVSFWTALEWTVVRPKTIRALEP